LAAPRASPLNVATGTSAANTDDFASVDDGWLPCVMRKDGHRNFRKLDREQLR